MRRHLYRWLGVAAAAAVAAIALGAAVAGPSQARPAVASKRLELRVPGDAQVRIIGPTLKVGFPFAALVQGAGDVNGDKKPDLLFANRQGHGGDLEQSFLLFGGSWPATIRLPAARSRAQPRATSPATADRTSWSGAI